MNTSWHSFVQPISDNHLIKGEWFTVRFMPDRITGEIFNIGVVFIDDVQNCHFKLIENANAFKCLFGTSGVANIAFMLDSVRELLDNNHYLLTPSPNIIYSTPQTAQGESINEILDDLFDSMVSLVCQDDEKEEKTTQRMGTTELRKQVFRQLYKEMNKVHDRIHQPSPYPITSRDKKKTLMVDMPIRNYRGYESTTVQEYYGTIISAGYLDPVHRRYNIDYVGCTNVTNCCEILGKDIKAGIIIYVPPLDDIDFTEAVQATINDELDKCLYSLHKMNDEGYNIDIQLIHSPEEGVKKTLEFIA